MLIVNEKQRNGWTRGRVLSVIRGQDGRVRQANVQTTCGVFRRPVSKLAVLQVRNESNAELAAEPEVRYGPGDVADTGSTESVHVESEGKTPRSNSERTKMTLAGNVIDQGIPDGQTSL